MIQSLTYGSEVTIEIKNMTDMPATDITFTFQNVTSAKVTAIDSFKTSAGGANNTLKLTGGNIPAGGKDTIKLDVQGTDKVLITTETSFAPKPTATETKDRGTSTKDDIFSLAVFGGSLGTTFAGIPIPANQYGYFYQFDRNALFPASPNQFRLDIGAIAPTSLGVLSDTWAVSSLLGDLPQHVSLDGIDQVTIPITDSMTPGNLSGLPGIAPSTWLFSNEAMVATYSTTFNAGDVSSILWFTDPSAPEIGGPLGIGGLNASLLGGGAELFTNTVVGPQGTPEPSSLVLFSLGMLGLLYHTVRIRRHAAANRAHP
jgi:hypothetical protein